MTPEKGRKAFDFAERWGAELNGQDADTALAACMHICAKVLAGTSERYRQKWRKALTEGIRLQLIKLLEARAASAATTGDEK